MAVTILGMGRSGSSLTARLLNISGLYLGPAEEMMEATDANEKGYWEHLGIYNINVRLLEMFGGTWETPAIFPAGWTSSDAVQPLREEALILLESMRGQARWGWKEPRTTATLPFWRALVPDLRFVVCLRNPLDVYSSAYRARLRQTWQYEATFEGTMALWRYYTELALRQTRPEERVIVSYEDYFRDHRKVLEPVWAFLGLDPVAIGTPEDEALTEFIEPSLNHSQHTLHDVLAHPYIPREVKQLYQRLLEDRAQLEAELSAASNFDTDASPGDSSMVSLLQTIEKEKEDSPYDEDLGFGFDPLEAQYVRARQLEEQLAQVCRTNEVALEQLQNRNIALQTALSEAEWQIDWIKSSRGVQLVLRARAARAVFRQKGLLALIMAVVMWMVG